MVCATFGSHWLALASQLYNCFHQHANCKRFCMTRCVRVRKHPNDGLFRQHATTSQENTTDIPIWDFCNKSGPKGPTEITQTTQPSSTDSLYTQNTPLCKHFFDVLILLILIIGLQVLLVCGLCVPGLQPLQ